MIGNRSVTSYDDGQVYLVLGDGDDPAGAVFADVQPAAIIHGHVLNAAKASAKGRMAAVGLNPAQAANAPSGILLGNVQRIIPE